MTITSPDLAHVIKTENSFIEMSRGLGRSYQEVIVHRSNVKHLIQLGWSITRLSKLSPSSVRRKWANAIDAMENKMNVIKAIKRPVQIEAIKFDGSAQSIKHCLEFMGSKVDTASTQIAMDRFERYCDIVRKDGIQIHTLEGTMHAKVGDFIIKGINGEFYPCKPDIFEKTYDILK